MKHHGVEFVFGQTGDDITFARVHGVACGSHDDAQCGTSVPLQLQGIKLAAGGRQHHFHQIGFQAHHDGLSFWIAHSAIELQCFGHALRINHQASIQKARVGNAVFFHALDGGHDDLAHGTRVNLRRNHWGWRVGTHATGVGAFIVI